jgi:hypothetical protein
MDYNKVLKHLANETSPLALDSGLQAIQSFAVHAPLSSHLDDHVKSIMDGLIKTCYSSSEKMYSKANSVVLQFCEDVNILEVVSVLLANVSNKKPKVPPNVLRTLQAIVCKFGPTQVPIAQIIQHGLIMNDIFQSANGSLREVAVLLVVDIASHLSSNDHQNQVVLERLFKDSDSGVMRSTQKEQYSTLLAEKEKSATTTTFTPLKNQDEIVAEMNSSAAAAMKVDSKNVSAVSDDDSAEKDIVVDLAASIKKVSAKVNQEKWALQHEALSTLHQELASSTSVSLKESSSQDMGIIVEWAKKLLRSGHVTVQIDVLKVIGQLCLKCKAVISGHIRGLMQAIAVKSKEKKLLKTVVETLTEAVAHTCTLDTVLEDVVEMITNKKSPAYARDGLLGFLQYLFTQHPARIHTDHLKPLSILCLSSCKDAESCVRDKSIRQLQSIFALCEERGKETQDVVKLFHALEREDNKLWVRVVPVKKDIAKKEVESSHQKIIEAVSAETEVDAIETVEVNTIDNTSTSANTNTTVVSSPGLMPYDDARAQLSELAITDWGDWFEATMKGTKWQDKVKCIESIASAISSTSKEVGGYSAATVSYLSAHTSKFKSANINLSKSAIRVLITLVSQCQTDTSTFHRGSAIVVINSVSEKLNDKKVKGDITELLTHFAKTASIGTALVLNSVVNAIDSCKTPALFAAYLEFLKEHIRGNAATSITSDNVSTLKKIAVCCESGCEHKIAQVKSMSAEVMAVLYHHLGLSQWQCLLPLSLQSKHRKAFDVACEKIGVSENIIVLGEKKGGGDDGAIRGNAKISDAGQSLSLPKKSLTTLLSKNILREINTAEGKTAWQVRKNAFESIIEACVKLGGYLLEYNKSTDEVLRALKFKLQDTQANNKPVALTAIASVLTNMEVDSTVKALRTVGSALVLSLTDNKRPMRDAAILNLQKIVQKRVDVPGIVGKSPTIETAILIVLLPGIIETLSHSNTIARLPLLTFLATNMIGFLSNTPEVQELVAPLIQCLMDKTSDVRVCAEEVLCDLVGRSCITDQGINLVVRDLSEAAKRTVSTAVERIVRHMPSDDSATVSDGENGNQMEIQKDTAETTSKSPVKSTLSASERVKNSPAKFGASKRIPLHKKSSTAADGTSAGTTATGSSSVTPTKSSDTAAMKRASSNSKSLFQSPMKSKNPAASASGSKGNNGSATKIKSTTATAWNNTSTTFSTPPSSPSRKSSGVGKEAEKKKKSVPKTAPSVSKSPVQAKPTTNHEAHLMKSMSEIGSLSRSSQSSTVLMYKLVSEKMQSLIDSQANGISADKSEDAEMEAFEETLRESTVDHIKLLNSLIDGASPGAIVSISTKSSPTKKTNSCDDEESGDKGLLKEANLLMVRLLKCLDIAFPQSNLIDVSLASASLSAIFALLKSTGVVNVLYGETRRDLLHHCLGHMVDDRLGNGSGSDFMEATTAKQINRALNIIALKLSADLGNLSALSTLLSVLQKLVITSSDLDASKMISAKASSRNRPSIKVLCTKPASKLLLKILSAEQATEEPFHTNHTGREQALSDAISQLAKVFECVQTNAAYMENEVIFSCAKTVLSAMIKPTAANADASKSVLILMDQLKISSNHFMTQLLLRLDRNSKQQQQEDEDSKKNAKKSNGLMFDVLSLQDEMKLQREAAHKNIVDDHKITSPAIIHVTDTLPSPPPRTLLLSVEEDQENAENRSSENDLASKSQSAEKGDDKLANMMQDLQVSSPESPSKSGAAADLMSRIARLKALSDQKGISNATN